MLQEELCCLFEDAPELEGSFAAFSKEIPDEWLRDAFQLTNTVTVRRRKLLPEDVIRLIIGMSLMRGGSIQSVANRLVLNSNELDNSKLAARSSLSNARQKLGYEPVEWLFNQSAQCWDSQNHEQSKWFGLNLYAIDGTMFRTEDTAECREHFGSANTATKKESGYPVLKMTSLMNVRSHIMIKAAVGGYRSSEITMASQLVDAVPNQSVIIMDKLYHSAELLNHIESTGEQRHWLTPLKENVNYQVLKSYSENDWLVERTLDHRARQQSPKLPKKWVIRVIQYQIKGHKPKLLATSLPHDVYSAEDIIKLYHERWEIELGYRNIKSSLLEKAVKLRSKKVGLVYQELYGMLIAYNLVRYEALLAANSIKVRPSRISFKTTLRITLMDYWQMVMADNLQSLPMRLKDLTETIKDFVVPEQDRPSYVRALKINPRKFPLKGSQPDKTFP